jgi:hypothetical protein
MFRLSAPTPINTIHQRRKPPAQDTWITNSKIRWRLVLIHDKPVRIVLVFPRHNAKRIGLLAFISAFKDSFACVILHQFGKLLDGRLCIVD